MRLATEVYRRITHASYNFKQIAHACITSPRQSSIDLCTSSLLLNFSSWKCESWELAPCTGHWAPGRLVIASEASRASALLIRMCHLSSRPSLNLGARLRIPIMVFPSKDPFPRGNDRLSSIWSSRQTLLTLKVCQMAIVLQL